MRTATNPSGKTVYFDEVHHRYFVGDVALTPVTTFVQSFFPTFDSQRIAEKFAKKYGRKTDDVLCEWEDARLKGEELGNAVHAYAYSEITKDQQEVSGKYESYYRGVDKALSQIKKKFKIVGAEQIVFSKRWGLAGTIDLLVGDSNGDIVILDWKSNKEIKVDNVWEKGLPPIAHLDDCELSRYSLQIGVYEFILREEDYYPGANFRRGLIHLVEDQPKWYKLRDMQAEIKEMLKWI